MSNKFFYGVICALALCLFAPTTLLYAQSLTSEPIEKIVAVVEDDVILQSELDRAVSTILNQYARSPQQLPPRDVLERQVLDRLIMMKLQMQRAESTGIRIGDIEVDQAVGHLAQQNKITVEQLRNSVEHDGLSFQEFRKNMREELTLQKLHQRIIQSRINVTDSEIDILLASNSLKTGEVRLSHILIGVPDGASSEQIQAAREKADEVKKQLDSGMEFSAAAMRYSQSQHALEGGDLGWRRYDEVPDMFAELVQGMEPGQISQPMRGPSGFHILKMVGKRESGKQVITEYHARHVLVKVTELVSSETAEKSIRNIHRRIVDGHEDFAKLAKEFSEDETSANLGGDMGWFQVQQFGTKVADVLSSLKDEEISEPFQTEAGWHILQRLRTRDMDRTADVLRAQARETLRNRKAEDEYDTFLRQLRSESYVDIRLPSAKTEKTETTSTPGTL